MMIGRQLDIDMRTDAEFMARIADMDFAVNTYCMFLNREWVHSLGDRWSASWREAGGLVADWRGIGETYIDFYMSDFFAPTSVNQEVQNIISEMFGRVGWAEMTPERELEYWAAALLQIAAREPFPTNETPDWYSRFHGGEAFQGGDPRSRLHSLARRGLVTQAEFLSLHRDVSLTDRAKALTTDATD
jgi:hypothetical protein